MRGRRRKRGEHGSGCFFTPQRGRRNELDAFFDEDGGGGLAVWVSEGVERGMAETEGGGDKVKREERRDDREGLFDDGGVGAKLEGTSVG